MELVRCAGCVAGVAGDAERTTCGLILTQDSLGVTEPVLPCDAKIVIRFGDRTFLTEVIDNRLKAGGRQFEVTEGLAQEMGLDGTQRIQWRFAAPLKPPEPPATRRAWLEWSCPILCVTAGINCEPIMLKGTRVRPRK